MQRRRILTGAGLSVLVAMLLVAALAGPAVAAGSPSASPSPSAGPKVTGAVPVIGAEEAWTGDQVRVNFEANGLTIDAAASELYIDGTKQEITPTFESMSVATETLVWRLTEELGKGDYDFKVVLLDDQGQQYPYEWTFTSTGVASGGSLIDFSVMRKWWTYILRGAVSTVLLTVISMVLACLFALFGALGRLSVTMTFRQAWQRYQSYGYMVRMVIGRIPYWLATFYTSLFRGTPLLLQIMFIYMAFPEVLRVLGLDDVRPPDWLHWMGFQDNYNPPPFLAGIAALSLNYGAYLTEVFRAGIQAVPKGQQEAAWALGLSGWQTQRRIILPQAFKIVIPAVGNDFIALIKDTSLVSVITVEETLRKAQLAGASSLNNFSTLIVAAVIYWALTIFFSYWQAKLEKKMARDKARKV